MRPQRSSNLIDSIPDHIGPQRMQPDRAGHFLRRGLLAVLLCVACAVPVMAAPVHLPAIVEPASQEHHVGKLIFVQLATPGLAAAKQFYGGLFGWTFRDIQAGETRYAAASRRSSGRGNRSEEYTGGRAPAAGLAELLRRGRCRRSKKGCVAKWREGALRAVQRPRPRPGAVFADPQVPFAALASSSGDPPDVLAAPGEWIWSSLIMSDPDTDAAFYQTLFGYELRVARESGRSTSLARV